MLGCYSVQIGVLICMEFIPSFPAVLFLVRGDTATCAVLYVTVTWLLAALQRPCAEAVTFFVCRRAGVWSGIVCAGSGLLGFCVDCRWLFLQDSNGLCWW
jgi:hypothetical protein